MVVQFNKKIEIMVMLTNNFFKKISKKFQTHVIGREEKKKNKNSGPNMTAISYRLLNKCDSLMKGVKTKVFPVCPTIGLVYVPYVNLLVTHQLLLIIFHNIIKYLISIFVILGAVVFLNTVRPKLDEKVIKLVLLDQVITLLHKTPARFELVTYQALKTCFEVAYEVCVMLETCVIFIIVSIRSKALVTPDNGLVYFDTNTVIETVTSAVQVLEPIYNYLAAIPGSAIEEPTPWDPYSHNRYYDDVWYEEQIEIMIKADFWYKDRAHYEACKTFWPIAGPGFFILGVLIGNTFFAIKDWYLPEQAPDWKPNVRWWKFF